MPASRACLPARCLLISRGPCRLLPRESASLAQIMLPAHWSRAWGTQVGLGAPQDYIDFLTQLASVHNAELELDEVRFRV